MEELILLEQETTQDNASCNEIILEDSQILPDPQCLDRTELQEKEDNMIEEQLDVQEQRIENKLNLKQQIDVKQLILEETKQYINMEEERKIMESSMTQQMTEVKRSIEMLRQKILDRRYIERREEIETNYEINKLMEIKNYTQATREIAEALKSYVESFEEPMNKLKFVEVHKKVMKKFEESSLMIKENINYVNKTKKEIKKLESQYEITVARHKNELESIQNNFKAKEDELKKSLDEVLNKNRQLEDEFTKMGEELNNETQKIAESSAKIKEIFEANMQVMEEFMSQRLKIEELESTRNGLLKSIECFTTIFDNLNEEAEKCEQQKSHLLIQLESLNDEISKTSNMTEDGDNIEEIEMSDFEQKNQHLTEELENLLRRISEVKKDNDALVKSNPEKQVTLLKQKHTLSNLQQELLTCRNSKENESKEIEKLEREATEARADIENKRNELETMQMEQTSLEKSSGQLKANIEKTQYELSSKSEQLNYLKNTLQDHLENKLKDLKEKLSEIEERDKTDKKRYSDAVTANKKKNDQYNRLRNLYLLLKTSTTKFEAQEINGTQSSKKTQQEQNEIIEAERTSNETSPKSILKSPGKSITPTKSVKFVGISSQASTSSNDMVNVNKIGEKDPFDELKQNLVERKRGFD